MKIVGVIPVKMNNVRTPGKNTKPFSDGTPLISCIQKTMLKVKNIDEVYVYCSNNDIKPYLLSNVKYIKRDKIYDEANADVIDMMYRFSTLIDADIYIQAHATAPFISSESIESGIEKVSSGSFDSSFSVTKMQEFLWKNGAPLNYSLNSIPRTQDMEPYYVETTGLYIFNREVIQSMHRRIGNNPYLIEVTPIEAIDINYPMDFDIADAVYTHLLNK